MEGDEGQAEREAGWDVEAAGVHVMEGQPSQSVRAAEAAYLSLVLKPKARVFSPMCIGGGAEEVGNRL